RDTVVVDNGLDIVRTDDTGQRFENLFDRWRAGEGTEILDEPEVEATDRPVVVNADPDIVFPFSRVCIATLQIFGAILDESDSPTVECLARDSSKHTVAMHVTLRAVTAADVGRRADANSLLLVP